jgi:muramidase (phage lysozyme)
MAVIDSKKLLPPAKSSGSSLATQKFLVPISNIKVRSSAIVRASDIKPTEKPEDGGGKIVLSGVLQIRESVVSIQRLIGSNTTLLQQSEERERKLLEKEKFESKEKKLEGRKGLSIPKLNIPSLPKTGFLDAIKRFLFYTLLGAAFVKFGKHIPKILEFSKKLIPAFEFLENFAGNILNGAVEFIDNGYKAYDKVREISKTIGGEDLQKKFDEFSKQFNTFANLAIIAGMSTMGGTDPKRRGSEGGRGGAYATGYAAGYAAGLASGKGIRPGAGFRDPGRYRAPGQARAGGFDLEQARRANTQARTSAPVGPRGPLDRIGRQFKGAAAQLETGTLFKRGSGIQRALYNAPGKIKGVIPKGAGRVFGRIPIIGGLVDFIISTVILKENPGRAAAKAVGATIGSALGTFIPIPFAGTILGGILGDIVGGALYDSLVGNNNTKVKAKAQGGQVTRGGKKVSGSSRRTIKKVRAKPPKIKPQKTIPGKDVGGRKEIEKLFPYSINPNQKSPLGVLETTSESLKKVPLLGGVMGASLDLAMGQKPDANVFKKIGYGFGALVQNAIDAETSNTISNIQKEIVGLAGGGVVPRTLSTGENIGMKIGERLAKTFEAMMNSKVNETLQSIRQQFGKEGSSLGGDGGGGGGDGGDGAGGGGQFSGSAANIPPEGKALLDAIAGSESGGYNSRYPSKTFDNNWVDHPRISEVIRSGPNKGKTSDAAGRYQFLSSTWDDYKPAKAFTPENQDIAAYRLAIAAYGYGESGLIKDLKSDPTKVARKLSRTWTSLPGGIEPNNATNGFLSRFEASVKKYKSAGGPLSSKGVKKFSRSDITSFFGQQESFRSKPHEGMDVAAPQGTPISFGMGGEVLGVWRTNSGAREANGGYGTYMDVKFSDGRIARIAHLSNVPSTIKKGSKFRANQIIAYSGGEEGKPGSGRSGGPHIHLEQLSKPMGIEETLRGKYDPLKGGLFDLIQRGGTQASIAPSTTQNLASGINQKASYEIAGGPILMLQKVIIEKPIPVGGGGMISGGVNNSSASTSPITASLYSA